MTATGQVRTQRRARASQTRAEATCFPLELPLRYALSNRHGAPVTGAGVSVHMSRTGILFRADCRPQPGDSMLVVADWPVTGEDDSPLKLVSTGSVDRVGGSLVSVAVHGQRLIRESELHPRFENVRIPTLNAAHANASRGVVLVDEDEKEALILTAVLRRRRWKVEKVDLEKSKEILSRAETPVALVITRSRVLLDAVPAHIPAILTADGADAISLPQGRRALLPKPLAVDALRDAIDRACARPRPQWRAAAAASAAGAFSTLVKGQSASPRA